MKEITSLYAHKAFDWVRQEVEQIQIIMSGAGPGTRTVGDVLSTHALLAGVIAGSTVVAQAFCDPAVALLLDFGSALVIATVAADAVRRVARAADGPSTMGVLIQTSHRLAETDAETLAAKALLLVGRPRINAQHLAELGLWVSSHCIRTGIHGLWEKFAFAWIPGHGAVRVALSAANSMSANARLIVAVETMAADACVA